MPGPVFPCRVFMHARFENELTETTLLPSFPHEYRSLSAYFSCKYHDGRPPVTSDRESKIFLPDRFRRDVWACF